jgi:AcrR family transcriptional regulator
MQRLPAAVRRTQLLDVAMERFAATGYYDTSMDDIAEAAGVTKPVLYQHFDSKHELFLELLDAVGRQLLKDVVTRATGETNPYQQVLAGFRAYFQFVCQQTSAFRLVFGGGARLTDDFADSIRRLEDEIAETIGRFVDADIDDSHRDLVGHTIVGLGEVAGRRWLDRQGSTGSLDPAEGELLAVRLADLVWAGLRGLPGSPR